LKRNPAPSSEKEGLSSLGWRLDMEAATQRLQFKRLDSWIRRLFGALRAYPKIPKWQRKNPGESFNAGFFRCLGYNFGICFRFVGS
jgi:hypothetical protein